MKVAFEHVMGDKNEKILGDNAISDKVPFEQRLMKMMNAFEKFVGDKDQMSFWGRASDQRGGPRLHKNRVPKGWNTPQFPQNLEKMKVFKGKLTFWSLKKKFSQILINRVISN